MFNIFKKETESINETMDEVKDLSKKANILIERINNDYDDFKNAARATLKIVIASALFGPPGGIIAYCVERDKGRLKF